jgi:hypothetical protein
MYYLRLITYQTLLPLFPCTYCAYKSSYLVLTYHHFSAEYLPNIIVPTMNSYLVLIVTTLLGGSLATPIAAPPTLTIAEIVASNPTFSTLLAALQAADLVDTLSGPGPFTVFAPDNIAFNKIPDADLEALLADVPALTAVLLRHVVPANIPVSAKICIIPIIPIVPVVYMARDIMIFMQANPLRGPLYGVGPVIKTFLGPEMAVSKASAIWAQKSQDFRTHPSMV